MLSEAVKIYGQKPSNVNILFYGEEDSRFSSPGFFGFPLELGYSKEIHLTFFFGYDRSV